MAPSRCRCSSTLGIVVQSRIPAFKQTTRPASAGEEQLQLDLPAIFHRQHDDRRGSLNVVIGENNLRAAHYHDYIVDQLSLEGHFDGIGDPMNGQLVDWSIGPLFSFLCYTEISLKPKLFKESG